MQKQTRVKRFTPWPRANISLRSDLTESYDNHVIVVLEFTFFTEPGVMLSGNDHLGKNCSHDSFYTLTHDAKCNGWEGISYADCQRKCILNELPTPCKNHPNVSVPSSGSVHLSSQYTLGDVFFHYIKSYAMILQSSVFNSSVGRMEDHQPDDGGFKPCLGRVLFS